MLKYQNKLASLKNGDAQDFTNERFYLKKRRDELQDEVRQLENNLQFINTKDDKNPLLVQQRKNIAEFTKELDVIKEKQKQLNILQRQLQKEVDEAAAAAIAKSDASKEETTPTTE
jgi:sugar-specific transcriptional regulator TrmB